MTRHEQVADLIVNVIKSAELYIDGDKIKADTEVIEFMYEIVEQGSVYGIAKILEKYYGD